MPRTPRRCRLQRVASLSAKVRVYCTDVTAPEKQARARALVARSAAAGEAVASAQVLNELFHTLTRQQKVPPDVAQALTQACSTWPVIGSDLPLVGAASERSIRDQLSIWDAMVIEAALQAGVRNLLLLACDPSRASPSGSRPLGGGTPRQLARRR